MANDEKNSVPNVAFIRPEVERMLDRWALIDDCIEGDEAVKAKGDVYLPRPNPTDKSAENLARYEQYLARAVFYNVAMRTHQGMVGQVLQKDPVVEVPTELAPLVVDIDGSGVSLQSQAKKVLGTVLAKGRCGLLVDFPEMAGPVTQEQVNAGEARPTVLFYPPQNIINWRVASRGARKVMTKIVLEETREVDVDGFELNFVKQWRVLFLDGDGNYSVDLYRAEAGPDGKAEGSIVKVGGTVVPKDSKGQPFKEIPFVFIGAVNNDEEVDLPPMYDLCVLNRAHFLNSADEEESSFVCGQPTLVLTGLSETWVKEILKDEIQIGARSAVELPVGGDAKLLQPDPNTMPAKGMERKEAQMVALGARLIENRSVQITATDAKIRYATEISVLGTVAKNTSEGYVRAFSLAGRFSGTDQPSKFELSVEFDLGRLTPQEQEQVVRMWQANAITTSEMRTDLRRSGVAQLDDEAYRQEVEQKIDYSTPIGNSGKDVSENGDVVENPPPDAGAGA